MLVSVIAPLHADNCCDPKGPFALGEQYPAVPATCETIRHWADRAPETDDRITLSIKGRLAAVGSDGALAYLVMCDPSGFQVMCVTYRTNGLKAGDVVQFAGGYIRVDQNRVMLDPCLASRE